jgi:hypothetical protein
MFLKRFKQNAGRAVLCLLLAAPALAADTAQVGAGLVAEKDIEDWQAAQACYGPDALTSRRAGFMRLYEAALLDEVLKEAGRPITKAEYASEVARIDRETRAPEVLACIKKHFGKKTDRYERVFIRPILAQRFIRDFVKNDPRAQGRAFEQREAVRARVIKEPLPPEGIEPFAEVAEDLGVAYSTGAYTLEAPEGETGPGRWTPFETAFIEQHLQELEPGGVKPYPVEDELSITFIRYTGKEGKKYLFEKLTINKLSTEAYLKSAPKVKCRIHDPELRAWVAGIKGNPLLAPADLLPEEPKKGKR